MPNMSDNGEDSQSLCLSVGGGCWFFNLIS